MRSNSCLDGILLLVTFGGLFTSTDYMVICLYDSLTGTGEFRDPRIFLIFTPTLLLCIAYIYYREPEKSESLPYGYILSVFAILAVGGCLVGGWNVIKNLWLILNAGNLNAPEDKAFETFIAGMMLIISAWYLYNAHQREARHKAEVRNEYKTPGWEYPRNWDNIRQEVLERDGYECGNCGDTENLHVHHIVPLSLGGTNAPSNLRTLCKECHTRLHPHMRS